MDVGFIQAATTGVGTPLPLSWLGRSDAPTPLPSWATVGHLSSVEVKNLLAQISYDKSQWNYQKIGSSNQLGRYQFSTQTLEDYGVLAFGSNNAYGTDCINYKSCWHQVVLRGTNSYSNYLFNCSNQQDFLNNTSAQEHLAYQIVYDSYTQLLKSGGILDADANDIAAGMIYVGWELGEDATIWRYTGKGSGADYFNSGRYSIVVLSQ